MNGTERRVDRACSPAASWTRAAVQKELKAALRLGRTQVVEARGESGEQETRGERRERDETREARAARAGRRSGVRGDAASLRRASRASSELRAERGCRSRASLAAGSAVTGDRWRGARV